MLNIILFIIEILIFGTILYLISKKDRKELLIFFIVALTVITNVMIIKKMDILGFEIPLGIASYVAIFNTCNILNQKYGKEDQYKVLSLITITSGITYLFLLLSGLTTVNSVNANTNIAYNNIFDMNFMNFLIFTTITIISLLINYSLYFKIRKSKNKIWLSNILSSSIIYIIDTIFYVILININNLNITRIIITIMFIYLFKIITSCFYTLINVKVCKLEK